MIESQSRRVSFEHDGHRFVAAETRGPEGTGGARGESRLRWCVTMDGDEVLEFHGAYPVRDAEVQTRVIEWYEIQKPRS